MAISSFSGQYRWLSNPYPVLLYWDGIWYRTAEHMYQALKAVDPVQRRWIAGMKTWQEAKQYGRTVKTYPDLDEMRIPLMYITQCVKYRVPHLRRWLLETGNTDLIEGNIWGDTFWGICDGKGENNLGQVIGIVREEIRTGIIQ